MLPRSDRARWAYSAAACLCAVAVVVAGVVATARPAVVEPVAAPAPAPSAAAPVTVPEPVPVAAPAPDGLPVFSYWKAIGGFPADPAPRSTAAVSGLRITGDRVVYDAPGGTPRALLPASISGLPVTVPVVARRAGWLAVLLPSVNRRVGWLTADGPGSRPLPDQLVLRRRTHELTWLRDGVPAGRWTVTTGAAATRTPLGRSFVLGRTTPRAAVYGGLDALVLGSVPDHPKALPESLRYGHTALHSWHRPGTFGRSSSNGCIRVPKGGQRTLLRNIAVGTVVTVLD